MSEIKEGVEKKKNMNPLYKEMGVLVTRDKEKIEGLNDCLPQSSLSSVLGKVSD